MDANKAREISEANENSLKELLNHMIEKGLSDQERQKGIFFADDLMQIQELLF